ncbi:MAG: hypothetical protein A2Y78_00280 [Acidobacteria bacterium RBG_13_68_16]|nr:MAG: hypothetical protein A2Y78_00280 [Acidobacteria bacterium RBG_13_68_16]
MTRNVLVVLHFGMSKVPPDAVQQIHEFRAQGLSLREIGKRLGLSHTHVSRLAAAPSSGTPAPAPCYAGIPAAGPVQAEPPPRLGAIEPALPADLEGLAVELDQAGRPGRASMVRAAIRPALPELPEGAGLAEVLRSLLDAAGRSAHEAAAVHDHGAASRHARTAAILAPVLARLEIADRGDEDAITIPRAEIAAARARLAARLEALAAGGVVCDACGARIRMNQALTGARAG